MEHHRVREYALMLVICLGPVFLQSAYGAGACSAPAIDISGASVTATNGVPTCAVGVSADKVAMLAAGAVDLDSCPGGEPGNRINTAATRWETSAGVLDGATGGTNYWLAEATGDATISVYFNDLDDGALYDDDETTTAKTLTVTGFKVGCHLTTDAGGSYKKYHDTTTSGSSTTGLSGTLTTNTYEQTTTVSYPVDEYATAQWTAIVVPDGTPMKGSVQINGDAAGTDGVVEVRTRDTDLVDAGAHSVTIGLNYLVAFSYTQSWNGDTNVSSASAGVGFQSDPSWLDTSSKKSSDVSVSETQDWVTNTWSHSPDTKYFTCKPTDTPNCKRSDFRAGGRVDNLLDPESTVAGWAKAGCKWSFSIPELPSYVTE